MDSNQPAVVLLSGGADSSVLLHFVAKRLGGNPLLAVSFDYGQRHRRELEAAAAQAKAAGAEHLVLELRFLGPLLSAGSALVSGGEAVPDLAVLSEEELRQPPTYVPNRNMMLLSMAAACAEARGVSDIYYGAQAQDEYGYWDCTGEFLARLNALFSLNRKTPVRIHAPFVRWPKAETIRLGLELGVDFAQTWSCYRGGDTACGTCPTCVERLKAFETEGARDPLIYAV